MLNKMSDSVSDSIKHLSNGQLSRKVGSPRLMQIY